MLPLKFPGNPPNHIDGITVLAGDVGATTTNLALYKMNGIQDKSVLKEQEYPSQKYKGITEIIAGFLISQSRPEVCCIGVAGPVFHGKAKLTNLPWEMDEREIAQQLGISKIYIINDLEAAGYGLAMLTDEDTVVIHMGSDQPSGNDLLYRDVLDWPIGCEVKNGAV